MKLILDHKCCKCGCELFYCPPDYVKTRNFLQQNGQYFCKECVNGNRLQGL